MANFFLVNHDFHSSRERWFCEIIFRETRNVQFAVNRDFHYVFVIYGYGYYLLNDIAWPWRHGWSFLCCDNVVGLVFGDLWPAIIFILCFVYFDHNGGSASSPSDKKTPSIRLVLFSEHVSDCCPLGRTARVCTSWKSRTTWIFIGSGKRRCAYIEGSRRRSALRIRWRLLRQLLWWFCSGGRWCNSQYGEQGTRFPFGSRRTRSVQKVTTTRKVLLWT